MSICEIQSGYADDLAQRIDAFGAAVDAFATDFEKNGPMVEGIPAEEASKRYLNCSFVMIKKKLRKEQKFLAYSS